MLKIDISEDWFLNQYGEEILSLLLKDHTTQQNIYWATDSYAETLGEGYKFYDPITIEKITGEHDLTIRPRAIKSREEQSQRAKDKAEVFTPSWICNAQNNLIDEAWFGRPNVFNHPDPNNAQLWINSDDKIEFPTKTGKTWKEYVADMRLEITCGEAPYLISRADAVTAMPIDDIKHRIGMLDRKLRVVSENCDSATDWLVWGKVALRSTYGFEWQGDNLLLAREGIFMSFIEHYIDKFGCEPNKKAIPGIAYIVSWNIWQMDGLTFGLPGYTPLEKEEAPKPRHRQASMFDNPDFCVAESQIEHELQPHEKLCRIKDFFNGVNINNPKLTNRSFGDRSAPQVMFKTLVNKENKQ